MKIIRNAVKCLLCQDIIESLYCHDFKICKCGSVFTDGGLDYIRRGGDIEAMLDLTEYSDNDTK